MDYKWKVALSLACLLVGLVTIAGMQALGAFNALPGDNNGTPAETGPITDISLEVNYGNGTTREWTGITLIGTTTFERSAYAATAQKYTMTYDVYPGGAYFIPVSMGKNKTARTLGNLTSTGNMLASGRAHTCCTRAIACSGTSPQA